MKSCLLTVSLLIILSSFLPFHHASGRNPLAYKSLIAEEECSACIEFMNKVFDAKRNSKEIQESDLKTARSVVCPENPDFPICQRNEVSVWEDAFLTPELASTFCESLPTNDCDHDK